MKKEISFCITCKNRMHQMVQTLKTNLENNAMHKSLVEFVLVDLGSTDGLQNWVLSDFAQELNEGYLKYYYTGEMKNWHASVAKNTSHYYAGGDFLVNLDCDNFTGRNGGYFVYEKLKRYGPKLLMHQFNGAWMGGTYGRIGVSRKYFEAIGGYNESFEPMGYQDLDLLCRLHEFGLLYKAFRNPLYADAIQNNKAESIKFCNSTLSWAQMNVKNSRRSASDVRSGKLVANNGLWGIREHVMEFREGALRPVATSNVPVETDL
jgi:glycosyltransferase involved in cell wall biosynthesis